MKRESTYQQITNDIIAAIELGAASYSMPWHCEGDPRNASTGARYRGINVLCLWAAAARRSYAHSLWATYRQWSELGAQVRTGEKGSKVVYWSPTESDEASEDGKANVKRGLLIKEYSVFNVSQVDGFAGLPTGPEPLEKAGQFVSTVPVEIRNTGDKAFYSPSGDYISVPPLVRFAKAKSYYSVLAHELTHWTGAESRLARDLTGRFGSQSYAMEELVAELGAAFVCSSLGLGLEPREDHAGYIANWLSVLREDARAIFTAASQAQAAADYLLAFRQEEPDHEQLTPPAEQCSIPV